MFCLGIKKWRDWKQVRSLCHVPSRVKHEKGKTDMLQGMIDIGRDDAVVYQLEDRGRY